MDKAIDKVEMFDVLSTFVPGIFSLVLAILYLKDIPAFTDSAFAVSAQEMIKNAPAVAVIVFVVVSYLLGLFLDAVRSFMVGNRKDIIWKVLCEIPPLSCIKDKKKFIRSVSCRNWRYEYLEWVNGSGCYDGEKIANTAVKKKVKDEVNIRTEDKAKEAKELNFIIGYCNTALETYGGIGKSARMLVLANMYGSLAVAAHAFWVLNLISGIAALLISEGAAYLPAFKFCRIGLIILTLAFVYNYNRYSRYRIEILFRGFYIKFVKPLEEKTE